MFDEVIEKKRFFAEYKKIIAPELYDEVLDLAAQLKGKRIVEVNATAKGGGVAEILRSQTPLMRDLGIDAHWLVLQAEQSFFGVTKMLHNAMQGDKLAPTAEQWQIYEETNQRLGEGFDSSAWDYVMIHDPQPAALRQFTKNPQAAKWAWRCHIDSSFPNHEVGERIADYVADYDGAVFTLDQYLLPHLKGTHAARHLASIPVAIDPLAPKNQSLDHALALKLVAAKGIDILRPFITQISRFDPWKDPLGVFEAWELARREVPELQLVLMGDTSADDPEGSKVLELVRQTAGDTPDCFIITESDDQLVDALQQTSAVVLQKSLREGFGLTVSEALWAGRPVIGGNVGGIPLQIEDGRTGFLVSTIEQTAKRIVELLDDPEKATAMGAAGHELVRQKFLLPRLMRDQLKFWLSLR